MTANNTPTSGPVDGAEAVPEGHISLDPTLPFTGGEVDAMRAMIEKRGELIGRRFMATVDAQAATIAALQTELAAICEVLSIDRDRVSEMSGGDPEVSAKCYRLAALDIKILMDAQQTGIERRDKEIERLQTELADVRRSWAASEEDYMSARDAFRDARQQLADVRRAVEHHANRANTVDALLKDALQGIQTGEVSRARYLIVTARDVIAVGSRQALAASPTAGDAASDSAGEG